MLGEEELEPDLHRRAVAEEDPALGRDQLVRPGEVRLGRLDAEPRSQPLAAPGAGEEPRTRAERPTGEPGESGPQAVAGERARHGRVGDVDETVEPVRVRPLVPVEQRPVDEQEPLLGPDLTRRLAEVRCLAALHRGQAVGLRQIEPPQQIVRDERRPRADDQRERPAGARVGQLAEQLAEVDCRDPREGGVVGERRVGRQALDLCPRQRMPSHVDDLDVNAEPCERRAQTGGRPVPRDGRRSVDRDDLDAVPSTVLCERLVAHLDGALAERVRRLRVVAHRRSCSRSRVRDALHENSLLPSGSPVAGS
jgi:hypothetical protein